MHSLEGGMVTTADAELARTLRLLRNQGMEQRYANEIVGANMRMTDVAAAIGRVQLRQLGGLDRAAPRPNAKFLDSRLTTVVTPPVADGARHVYHQYTVRVAGGPGRAPARSSATGASAAPSTTRRRSTGCKPYLTEDGTAEARGTCRRPSGPPPRCSRCRSSPALTPDELDRIADAVEQTRRCP